MTEPVDMLDPRHYAAVRKPPEQARPLPNWCYTSPTWYRLEVERVFMRSWNYAGHGSQIPNPGDYIAREIASIPIILMRGDDGVARAFYNSCRHRGARVVTGEGNCKTLACPYHSWTYARDGGLIATPLIEEDDNLRHADLPLLSVRLAEWAGFLFVTFTDEGAEGDPGPLDSWLGDMIENCAGYQPETLVCTRRKAYEGVKANWKLHFENFNDSLHIPFIHGGTLARQKVSGRKRSTHEEFEGQAIVHFTSHQGSRGLLEGQTGFPRIPTLSGRYTEGTYYPCILPSTMMAWTIDCMFMFDLQPTGPETLDIAICSFFPKETMERDDFDEVVRRYYDRLDVILPEDNDAVELQQPGLHVPVPAASRFTHMETLCHSFDNWILDKVIGPVA